MTELWAVHTLGPDEILPCATRRLAVRNATWLNLGLARLLPVLDSDDSPLIYNVPVRWDGTPEGHATFLAAEEKEDVRWSDVHLDPIGDLVGDLCRSSRYHGTQTEQDAELARLREIVRQVRPVIVEEFQQEMRPEEGLLPYATATLDMDVLEQLRKLVGEE